MILYKTEETIFLTFDFDWASDEVLKDTINIIERESISATLFVTHETRLLDLLHRNPAVELGIHPNFNEVTTNTYSLNNVDSIIQSLKKIVPEAVSIRSHSLVQSSKLLDAFYQKGLMYDVNMLIPAHSGIELHPYRHWNGMIRVPFFWEDDVHCIHVKEGMEPDWNVARFLDRPGLKVFNFHPIHVFLNTESLRRYEISKEYSNDAGKLCEFFCSDDYRGTRVFLNHLIKEARIRGIRFGLIRDVVV